MTINRNVRACIAGAVCGLALVSCVYIVSTERVPVVIEARSQCGLFIPPRVEPIPAVPQLTLDQLRNHDQSETVLVDTIKKLRDYARDTQSEYDRAYSDYRRTCR